MLMKSGRFAFPIFVLAATSAPQILLASQDCTLITKDSARLACYDEVAGFKVAPEIAASMPATEEPAIPPPVQTAWQLKTDKSAMTDQATVFLSVPSNEYVQCQQFGSSAGPLTLAARCMEDTTVLMILGDCHFASGFEGYGDVTMRTDKDKAVTRSFEASTDSAALGIWTGGRSVPAIKSLIGKEQLVVRVTPFGMSPIEATFDVRGLEDAVKPLREECKW